MCRWHLTQHQIGLLKPLQWDALNDFLVLLLIPFKNQNLRYDRKLYH